jgi:ABC-type multidrug transport system permease subunit
MIPALSGFESVVRKEFLHLRRDPATLVFALLTPMMQFLLLGYAINYDIRHIPTVVVDMDRSRESRSYIASLSNTQYLEIVGYRSTPEQAGDALRSNSARVAVIVPPDFSRRYGTATPPTVRVLLDGSDSQVAMPARLAFNRPPDDLRSLTVEPRFDVLFNPQMRTQVYTIPGLLGVILQLVTVSLTSFSFVREREQGTLEQLMVSPVGRLALTLGKLIPYFVLATLELIGFTLLGRMIFDVPIAGSFSLLFLLSLPFIFASLSLGLLISSVARTQGQALQMTLLTTLPSVLLTGYIAPRETLPGALYLLSGCLPVTYFIQIARGVMVRGATFSDLAIPTLGLLVLTGILMTLTTTRFKKQME